MTHNSSKSKERMIGLQQMQINSVTKKNISEEWDVLKHYQEEHWRVSKVDFKCISTRHFGHVRSHILDN